MAAAGIDRPRSVETGRGLHFRRRLRAPARRLVGGAHARRGALPRQAPTVPPDRCGLRQDFFLHSAAPRRRAAGHGLVDGAHLLFHRCGGPRAQWRALRRCCGLAAARLFRAGRALAPDHHGRRDARRIRDGLLRLRACAEPGARRRLLDRHRCGHRVSRKRARRPRDHHRDSAAVAGARAGVALAELCRRAGRRCCSRGALAPDLARPALFPFSGAVQHVVVGSQFERLYRRRDHCREKHSVLPEDPAVVRLSRVAACGVDIVARAIRRAGRIADRAAAHGFCRHAGRYCPRRRTTASSTPCPCSCRSRC